MKSLILSDFHRKEKNNVVDRSPQGDRELTFVILNGAKRSEESRFYAVWEKRFFVLRTQNDNSRSASPDLFTSQI
ncbi:MAG: hypothetical protein AMJ90_00840 [candidate division Zixibacteria bacterium SM23_73_2]|nr:MAG: hypothetical protein AMJ90_00840 [candidate division Zixibacteria bacterium SM23_73_2]